MKTYNSILDQLLDDGPDWDKAGLGDAHDAGEKLLDVTHKMVDGDWVEDIEQSKATPEVKGKRRLVSANEGDSGIVASQADWRNHSAKAMTDEGVLSDALMSLEQAAAPDQKQIEKREVTEAEVKSFIKKLLNEGTAPAKVAAQLDKLAELVLFDKQMSNDYLNRQSGILGMAYIEPNSFMESCPDTYQRQQVKLGGVKAKSVKQISACTGCTYFKKDASGKNCNLYHLPIVANSKELLPIINKITAGVPKESKKAALVKLANREQVVSHKPVQSRTSTLREANPDERVVKVIASNEFTEKEVVSLRKQGNNLESIYKHGYKKVGSVQAKYAIKAFVDNLRKQGKHSLPLEDYTFLKSKLGINNVTVDSKPNSIAIENHKVAHDAPKDGHRLLADFDLHVKKSNTQIEIEEPERLDVEIGSKPRLEF